MTRKTSLPFQFIIRPRLLRWIFGLLLANFLSACTTTPRPDLSRLYRVSDQLLDTTPVILIPGLFGSKLRNKKTGKEVWPGSVTDILFSDYRELALKFDPQTLQVLPDDLEAYDVADQVLGKDIYGPIIQTLEKFGGYVRGVAGTPVQKKGQRRYYVFPYDFRQDNTQHAAALDRLIETVRKDYGEPNLRVDFVAHSMDQPFGAAQLFSNLFCGRCAMGLRIRPDQCGFVFLFARLRFLFCRSRHLDRLQVIYQPQVVH